LRRPINEGVDCLAADGPQPRFDRYLIRVKSATESKYPWDYLEVVTKIPAEKAFRAPGAGGCALVKQ
jgi:hypothetical protein